MKPPKIWAHSDEFYLHIFKLKTSKEPAKTIGFYICFSNSRSFEKMKIKVVWMSSNFERFHEILNQANSENTSCLSHVELQNLPGSSKPGARDDLVFFPKINFGKKKNYLAASKDGQLSPDRKQTGWLKNPGHVAFRVSLLTIGCPTLAFWSRWNLDINWRVQQLVCKKKSIGKYVPYARHHNPLLNTNHT